MAIPVLVPPVWEKVYLFTSINLQKRVSVFCLWPLQKWSPSQGRVLRPLTHTLCQDGKSTGPLFVCCVLNIELKNVKHHGLDVSSLAECIVLCFVSFF